MNARIAVLFGSVVLFSVVAAPRTARALWTSTEITRESQDKHGLVFQLSAAKKGDSVTVRLTVPRSGKLKNLVAMDLCLKDDKGRILLLSPLAMTEAVNKGQRVLTELVVASLKDDGASQEQPIQTVSVTRLDKPQPDIAASFQIASELAEHCSIELVDKRSTSGSFFQHSYSVQLKTYITEAKKK